MKKLFYLLAMVVTLFTFTACSGGGPGSALKEYVEAMQKGDYEKCVDGIALVNVEPDQQQSVRDSYVALMKKGAKNIERKGGIKNIEILSEEIASDGNTAVVKLKLTYGNGKEETEEQKMVKTDGKWLMDVGK